MIPSLTELASAKLALDPAVVRALGWTLLHTLWQGALVAGLLAGALRLLGARAAVRYALSAGALLLVPLLAAGTFGLLYEPAAAVAPRLTVLTVSAPTDLAPAVDAFAASLPPAVPTFAETAELTVRLAAARLEPWLPALVAAWTLGLGLMLLRLGGGLVVVRRLRRVGVAPGPAAWQARATELAARLGIGRQVRLLESSTVAGPVAVGWLRPAVLLPVGLLAELPPAQLDAILAHELAHIRRHDYALNILQAIVEAAFFFHPGVWWMSAQVRREREHCCDDLAVRLLGGDARPLARALAALAEWTAAGTAPSNVLPRLSLAATGGALLQRVRRLLVPTPAAATRPGGGALAGSGAVALVLLMSLTLSAVARGPRAELAREADLPLGFAADTPGVPYIPVETVAATADDSTKKRRVERRIVTSTTRREGAPNLIIVKDKKNRLREVYVDGKKVPKDRVGEYQPYVDEALNEPKERRHERAAEQDLADARDALRDARRELHQAERERDRETRRDPDGNGERRERDVHIRLNGPRAEINGRVIHLDSLERALDDRLTRAFSDLDFGNFHLSISDGDDNVEIERVAPPPPPPGPPMGNPDGIAPVPPVPPMPPLPPTPPTPGVAPIPPVPPLPAAPPAAPRAPKTGDAKARQRYDQQMAAYNQRMAAYGQRMDEYGKRMAEYGKRMEEYGRQQARAAAPRRLRSLHNDVRFRSDKSNDVRPGIHLEMGSDVAAPADTKQLGDELRRDGLIGKDDKAYRVQYEEGELRINGKQQPAEVRDKYRQLLKIPEGDRGSSFQFQVSE